MCMTNGFSRSICLAGRCSGRVFTQSLQERTRAFSKCQHWMWFTGSIDKSSDLWLTFMYHLLSFDCHLTWHELNWHDDMTCRQFWAVNSEQRADYKMITVVSRNVMIMMGGLAWPGPPHPPLRVGTTRALTDQPTSLRTKQKLIGLSFAISRRNLQAPNSRIYWQDSWT